MDPIGRRSFNAILAAISLSRAAWAGGKPVDEKALDPESFVLSRNGWVPNNEHLPVLFYRGVFDSGRRDPASYLEELLERNGWPAQWRNGIYSFHHYHSTAHEVLGVAGGQARVMLGGENGREVALRAGDAVVLPAGTGHCELDSSRDFLVVGAYPPEQSWDLCRTAPSREAVQRMERLPFPRIDPVSGVSGALPKLWQPR
jgi:uncharacterized protein YjlB